MRHRRAPEVQRAEAERRDANTGTTEEAIVDSKSFSEGCILALVSTDGAPDKRMTAHGLLTSVYPLKQSVDTHSPNPNAHAGATEEAVVHGNPLTFTSE